MATLHILCYRLLIRSSGDESAVKSVGLFSYKHRSCMSAIPGTTKEKQQEDNSTWKDDQSAHTTLVCVQVKAETTVSPFFFIAASVKWCNLVYIVYSLYFK